MKTMILTGSPCLAGMLAGAALQQGTKAEPFKLISKGGMTPPTVSQANTYNENRGAFMVGEKIPKLFGTAQQDIQVGDMRKARPWGPGDGSHDDVHDTWQFGGTMSGDQLKASFDGGAKQYVQAGDKLEARRGPTEMIRHPLDPASRWRDMPQIDESLPLMMQAQTAGTDVKSHHAS